MSACSVPGCDAKVRCVGLCNRHYRRMRKYGDVNHVANRPAGAGTIMTQGYCMIEIGGRCVLRHVLIAERALGKPLPAGAHVHHVDGDRSNDRNDNLVICPDAAYHQLLHRRQRALDACGHADWRKCHICKQYDAPENLRFYEPSGLVRHMACWRAQYYERKAAA